MTMQKLTRWVGLAGGGLAALAASCYSATSVDDPVAAKTQEIIGGFGANSSQLNAVGSLNIWSPNYGFQYQCTAVLVTKNMALTARQCADGLVWGLREGGRAYFGIGPNAINAQRYVEVAEAELPPYSPDKGTYNDVAVLHLDEEIEDITPVSWASVDASSIGQKLVAVGYGVQNQSGVTGTRRLGELTLRATSGRKWELIFGSFEAYFKWNTGADLPAHCSPDVDDDAGVPLPEAGTGGVGGSAGKGGRGGSGGKGGVGGYPAPDDYLCQWAVYLRDSYENDRLENGSRFYAGGLAGEAQPCDGDGGGPLLRIDANGTLTVFGVLTEGLYSNSPNTQCDRGALYSWFDEAVLTFLDHAKGWVDPCGELSTTGQCSGTTAERCSGLGEGKRRKLSTDCSTIGLSCEPQNDGSVGCGVDDSYYYPGPPVPIVDVNGQIFHAPQQP